MAITKLLKIKQSKKGKASAGLQQCLRYIANPEKTENLLLVGGSCGGDPDLTYADMLANKQAWEKTVGTQGYHYILSLPPDEHPDTDVMRKLAEEFCQKLLKGQHLYSYAIHVDRGHLHAHIVFDSVSMEDGRMWKSGKYDWLARIQPITDELCRKYGLRTLDFDPANRSERKNQTHAEWEYESVNIYRIKKDVSWNDIIRADIDQALAQSADWTGFIRLLRSRHYEIKDGVHLSIRPEGKERFVRTGRLGESYSKESLFVRLGRSPEQQPQPFGDPEPMLNAIREYLERGGDQKLTAEQKVFYQRWYAYNYVRQAQAPWRYRKDLTDLGQYTDRCAYMFRHDITSLEDLKTHLHSLKNQQEEIRKKLTRVSNQIYNTPVSAWRKLEKLRAEMDTASEVDRPRLKKKMNELMAGFKDVDLAAEAERYRCLQEHKSDLQQEARKLKAEMKLAGDLAGDFDKSLSPDDILQDPRRYVPDTFTRSSYQRITVNRVLFRNTPEGADFMKVKIPGQEAFILLYKADTKLATDGSFASSYIYDHLSYKVTDANDRLLRTVPGSEAKTFFTDRTRERRPGNGR